jgi:signal transduction histidine kinase
MLRVEMQDFYQIPALILTTLLLPAFGHLYLRSRDTRTLLWFLAFLCTVVRMVLLYPMGAWDFSDGTHPWLAASGQACALLSSGLFLASLSLLKLRVGRIQVLYVVPYIAPMIAYAILAYGMFRGVAPHGAGFWLLAGLACISFVVGFRWNQEKGNLPIWIGTVLCLLFGGVALWFCFRHGLYAPLILAESGNHLVTGLLVIFVFRRFSSGVALSVLGFLLWSFPVLLLIPQIGGDPVLHLTVVRLIVMAKVVTALGLILVALENELALNRLAGERERRARRELEAYSKLEMGRRRVEDFDRQGPEICREVVENSRFGQAALILLNGSGVYRLVGSEGLDQATEKALDALVARVPVDGFRSPEFARPALDGSQTLSLDLKPWFTPGDDLAYLRFTSTLAVPLKGGETVEGALLLAGMRNQATEALRMDDLLPLEMLATRIQAVRSQTTMLERLIDSEKFAGLGQLAGNVTQQLNNPLTVILGYATLLEETLNLEAQERRGLEAILSEARHMRSTLESLSRVTRSPIGPRAAISVPELLAEMEDLHRSEFLQRSIEFQLKLAPTLPRVLCHSQQLRQAILHCLRFSVEAVESLDAPARKMVRLEATSDGRRVQIVVAHSGPSFHFPDRAFDPYVMSYAGGMDTAGLGLSLCATILRDNNGQARAVNLEPQGAAITLDLQAA